MTLNDIIGLLASYIYAFGLLFFVEFIGKKLGWSTPFTRKLVHIGAGLWVWPIVLIFDHWYFGVIPFFTFIFLNYAFYRKQSFSKMDSSDSTPGTVYFAFSITTLFLLFWRSGSAHDRVYIALAGTMAMTLGDAFASMIGMAWGKKQFHVFGNTKTLLGSGAMLVFSLLGIFFSLYLLSDQPLFPVLCTIPTVKLFLYSLFAAGIATTAEALSPVGTDNLSVPLLTGAALFFLIG